MSVVFCPCRHSRLRRSAPAGRVPARERVDQERRRIAAVDGEMDAHWCLAATGLAVRHRRDDALAVCVEGFVLLVVHEIDGELVDAKRFELS